MKKFLLIFSSLLLFISCDNNENTPEPSIIKEEVQDDMIGGIPDPSFVTPVIQTLLYFRFTNAAGENLFDPESPAYIGEHSLHCKVYMEDSYEDLEPNRSPFFVHNTDIPTETGDYHYCVVYDPDYQFRETKLSESLTLERMWLKFLLSFNDGTTYEVLVKIGKHNNGTYAMGAEKIYVNGELKFDSDHPKNYYILIPIVKE